MTDDQVCCGCVVVHPDGDVELNVGAADWRCWRRAYSCQQGSGSDIDKVVLPILVRLFGAHFH